MGMSVGRNAASAGAGAGCDAPGQINPDATFQIASLYTGRLVNPAQTRTVVQTAIRTALSERGPTVISVPGDVGAKKGAGRCLSGGSTQPSAAQAER
jgi:thiamine pyrophosphate-dependent acetolactate synthase large subunit-like protein